MGRTATARTARATRTSARRGRTRTALERCQHGLLRGTCAICLEMEETTDDLHASRLAPEERPGHQRNGEEESERDAEGEE